MKGGCAAICDALCIFPEENDGGEVGRRVEEPSMQRAVQRKL